MCGVFKNILRTGIVFKVNGLVEVVQQLCVIHGLYGIGSIARPLLMEGM